MERQEAQLVITVSWKIDFSSLFPIRVYVCIGTGKSYGEALIAPFA